jgi:SEC-C motif
MNRQEMLEEYKRIRDARSKLHTEHFREAVKNVGVAAQQLGMMRGNQIVLDSEDDASILCDYCLYAVLEGGKSLVERAYEGHLPAEGTHERRAVEGMLRARFAFLRVEEIDEGLGLFMRDLGRNERLFIADLSLSKTSQIGNVFASRVLDYGDFCTLTGAGLPLFPATYEAIQRMVRQYFGREIEALGVLGREDDAKLSMLTMRAALALHANQYMSTVGPNGDVTRKPPPPEIPRVRAATKVGRNEPCPCGSGRKYKKCCGAAV